MKGPTRLPSIQFDQTSYGCIMRFSFDLQKSAGLILAGITVSLLGLSGASAQASVGSPVCAARDVELITLIEDHGSANDVAPERLAKAGLTQMEARLACSAGRQAEGMALYDESIRSLGPMLSHSGR
jgi:hypothetical protein